MRDVVVHWSGREIDLSRPTPGDWDLLREVYEERGRGKLRCLKHGGDVHLKMMGGKPPMWGAHYPGAPGAGETHAITMPMSTEHKTQIEYIARAVDRAGLPVVTDRKLPGAKRRPDVVVDGSTGFEVQRSAITLASIKTRTTQAYRAGLHTVTWLSDAAKAPAWMGIVPGMRHFFRDWLRLPAVGEAKVVGGLVRLGRKRCTSREWLVCPQRGGAPCGQWHITRELMGGVTLDEVTVGLHAGAYVPVKVREHAFIALAREAGQFDVPLWEPPPKKQRVPPSGRVECRAPASVESVPWTVPERPAIDLFATPSVSRCQHWIGTEGRYCDSDESARRYITGWRCESHAPAMTGGA